MQTKIERTYGKAFLNAVVEANEKVVLKAAEEDENMGKVMEEILHDRIVERENIARMKMLGELVKDGMISMADAIKKSGMTEAAFRKVAML